MVHHTRIVYTIQQDSRRTGQWLETMPLQVHSAAPFHVRRSAARWTGALVAAIVLIAATEFPYDVGRPLSAGELEKSRNYYADAYKKANPAEEQPTSEFETRYIRIAAEQADGQGIKQQVSRFAAEYGLRNGAVLDVGSGRGYLQDIVENYSGLDISSSVSRFYHKKFVLGSAAAMPFPDNSFDGVWSIWVLEHVPNPEQAVLEIRRVAKPNAVLFLYPAWDNTPWAAQGYNVRPYSDFDLTGKLIKAGIPVRRSALFKAAANSGPRPPRPGIVVRTYTAPLSAARA